MVAVTSGRGLCDFVSLLLFAVGSHFFGDKLIMLL